MALFRNAALNYAAIPVRLVIPPPGKRLLALFRRNQSRPPPSSFGKFRLVPSAIGFVSQERGSPVPFDRGTQQNLLSYAY
jgi:hypothetical protein